MTPIPSLRQLAAVLVSVLAMSAGTPAQAQAPASPDVLAGRYPYGAIQSVVQADQALVEVERTRASVEAAYVEDERLCYPKFFTTACLDEAKERRRAALARLKSIEVEANTFKRRARAAERDNALSEQKVAAENELREREAAAARRAAEASAAPMPSDAEIIAEQKRRADNVAAWEKKQREAAQRQRERDARLQANAQKAAEREAERQRKEAESQRKEAERARKKEEQAARAAERAP